MSTKLDDLFAAAAGPSAGYLDADLLWRNGRRRRRLRQGGAALLTVAALAVGGVVGTGLLTEVGTPTVDPAANPEVEVVPEPEPVDRDVAPDRRGEELRDLEEYLHRAEREAAAEAEQDAATQAEDPEEDEPAPEPGPQPDGSRVSDPCAAHQGGEPRAFIDVVSPVAGQQVESQVALVGCSSVYEATVRYRLVGPGGAVVTDSFTTATAGGPDIGEFRETITLAGAGQYTLEVFWDSPADGSEADKSTIVFEAR